MFNGKRTPKKKPYANQPIEALTAYGSPVRHIPDYNSGCQFHVDEKGFCNAPSNGPYCPDHARICGLKYTTTH